MNVFPIIQDELIIILEVACYYLFQDIFCKDYKVRSGMSISIWIVILSTLSLGVSYLFASHFVIKEIMIILIFALGLYAMKKDSLRKSFLISAMFAFLLVIADLITIVIQEKILVVHMAEGHFLEMLLILMSKSLLLLLIAVAKRMANETWNYAADISDEVICIVFPMISICMIAAIISKYSRFVRLIEGQFIWGVIFSLLAMNVLLLFFLKSNSEKAYLLEEKRLIAKDMKGQQLLYRSLEEKIELQRSISHDHKNHLSYIKGLLEQKEYQKISDYLEKINGRMDRDLDMIDTNHPVINTVVNAKYYEAKNAGATIVCKINDLSNIRMDEVDMIVLLSNLFNNAIEAVKKCEKEKVIKFKILHEKEELLLAFENTYHGKQKKVGEVYETTKKEEKGFHGIGMKNIIRIVTRYHGVYQFDAKEEKFYSIIMIPMKKEVPTE